jgi:carbonic anhydrase
MGTERVVVIGHTDCGLGPGEEDRVREALRELGGSAEGYVFDVEAQKLRQVQ